MDRAGMLGTTEGRQPVPIDVVRAVAVERYQRFVRCLGDQIHWSGSPEGPGLVMAVFLLYVVDLFWLRFRWPALSAVISTKSWQSNAMFAGSLILLTGLAVYAYTMHYRKQTELRLMRSGLIERIDAGLIVNRWWDRPALLAERNLLKRLLDTQPRDPYYFDLKELVKRLEHHLPKATIRQRVFIYLGEIICLAVLVPYYAAFITYAFMAVESGSLAALDQLIETRVPFEFLLIPVVVNRFISIGWARNIALQHYFNSELKRLGEVEEAVSWW